MPATGALLLLLLDSRAPAGAHSHSGGMEPAVTTGFVAGLADVEDFCRGRLRTSGQVAAAFAAAACGLWPSPGGWRRLDDELSARLPSEAMRAASRQLGGGLRRLVRSMAPTADLSMCAGSVPPHHAVMLGIGVAVADGDAGLAARAAALATCTAPASAAVRLLGLDPFAVQGILARLSAEVDAVAAAAMTGDLPANSAPAFDLLADVHLTSEVRLFAS
jgi:urease accessory protein